MIKTILYLINLGLAITSYSYLLRGVSKGMKMAGEYRIAIKEHLSAISLADKTILEVAKTLLSMVVCFVVLSIPILNIAVIWLLYKNEDTFADKVAENLVNTWDKNHSGDIEH